ncbi:hypothetical protein AMATHDRAFT_72651 [Amanita thiersii Skay4041]|uniref:HORMA domain-containing protein n=1 Tax=Amanita thiersii Skay4041 TaxID=703135 RepID=A0A2A9NV70_9AGAR|nr:hypothetical protein AMATHDRAFT_72651 [Amanita thiersii Skay4041]
MSNQPLTYNQTTRAIADFIEVAIHTILYVRQIYPAQLFVRRKKYNTPVFQSRHPALNEYITGAVKAIEVEISSGAVDKVVIVIKDKEHIALERFIFSIETMIEVEGYNKDTSVENAVSGVALSQYFRAFLVKLNMIESQLGPLDLLDDGSFAIVLELKDNKAPSRVTDKEAPLWIPADGQHTTAGMSDKAELHMIRAVNTGIINM